MRITGNSTLNAFDELFRTSHKPKLKDLPGESDRMAYPGSTFSPQPNRRLSVGFASATQLRANLITCIYSNVLPTWLLEADASGSLLLLRGFVRRMRGIPARAETRSGTPHMYILPY